MIVTRFSKLVFDTNVQEMNRYTHWAKRVESGIYLKYDKKISSNGN